MKNLKKFLEFKMNNEVGDLITQEDIIRAKNDGKSILADIIIGIPKNDPKEPLRILDIDEDGLVTIDYKGEIGEVELKNIKEIV